MTDRRKYPTQYIARELEPLRTEEYVQKVRKCLRCRKAFKSWGKANWICPACKELRGANTHGPSIVDANEECAPRWV